MAGKGDWILATEQAGYSRHFDAVALPVSFGGEAGNDLVLADVTGSVQIDQLDGVFFVQPSRGTTNARLDGERLTRSQRLNDGSVIALDTARLTCRLRDGRQHRTGRSSPCRRLRRTTPPRTTASFGASPAPRCHGWPPQAWRRRLSRRCGGCRPWA